jgi:hypothetical protein
VALPRFSHASNLAKRLNTLKSLKWQRVQTSLSCNVSTENVLAFVIAAGDLLHNFRVLPTGISREQSFTRIPAALSEKAGWELSVSVEEFRHVGRGGGLAWELVYAGGGKAQP